MILSPLESLEVSKDIECAVTGISELLFEVAYGAGEGLHSKAKEVLTGMLYHLSE